MGSGLLTLSCVKTMSVLFPNTALLSVRALQSTPTASSTAAMLLLYTRRDPPGASNGNRAMYSSTIVYGAWLF